MSGHGVIPQAEPAPRPARGRTCCWHSPWSRSGTNFVVIRVALGTLPLLLFATLRFTLALLPAMFAIHRKTRPTTGRSCCRTATDREKSSDKEAAAQTGQLP